LLVLSRDEGARLFDIDLLLERLERAFIELSAGRCTGARARQG